MQIRGWKVWEEEVIHDHEMMNGWIIELIVSDINHIRIQKINLFVL